MNLQTALVVLRKELLDIVRDHRALMFGLILPLLMYPLLAVMIGPLTIVRHGKMMTEPVRVAITENSVPEVRSWLEKVPNVKVIDSSDPTGDVVADRLDVVVACEDDVQAKLDRHETVHLTLSYDPARMASLYGMQRVRDGLDKLEAELLQIRLADANLNTEFGTPITISAHSVSPPRKVIGLKAGIVLAALIIMMITLSATYPAMDLTVGEKVRGTFETLLSTPISKADIIGGKFLALLAVTLTSVILNIASIVGTGFLFMYLIKDQVPSDTLSQFVTLSPATIASMLLLLTVALVPLTFMICAAMMTAAVLARDYKDANYSLTPAILLFCWPLAVGILFELELDAITQFVPILNTTLLFSALLAGEWTLQSFFIVCLTNLVFAAFALALTIRIFNSEDVVLSEERGIPFSFRSRSDLPSRDAPTVGLSLLLFAGAVLLMIYGALPLQSWRMLPGLLITEWLFILGLPLFALWLTKVNWRTALSLYRPSFSSLAGAIVLALASVPLIAQVAVWQNHILPFPKELEEQMRALLTSDGTTPSLLFLLFVAAFSPAVCEEVLFRGAILSGLRTKLHPAVAVIITGILFGLLHLMIWRILLTALLGILIGYVVVRSGSIFPGMLFHFVVNASAILTVNLASESTTALLDDTATQSLPPMMLIAATAAAALGIGLIELGRRTSDRTELVV